MCCISVKITMQYFIKDSFALRVGQAFATMYNEQGEVGKLYEEIIRYKICSQKNIIVNDDWNFFSGMCT